MLLFWPIFKCNYIKMKPTHFIVAAESDISFLWPGTIHAVGSTGFIELYLPWRRLFSLLLSNCYFILNIPKAFHIFLLYFYIIFYANLFTEKVSHMLVLNGCGLFFFTFSVAVIISSIILIRGFLTSWNWWCRFYFIFISPWIVVHVSNHHDHVIFCFYPHNKHKL